MRVMASLLGNQGDPSVTGERVTHRKRVFIVDDHPTLREGLARSIKRLPELEVCGDAANYKEAIAGVAETRPDLVTMDISLPDKNGLELIKELISQHPKLNILVFSMHDETVYAERAIRAGAKGYINKGAAKEELATALQTVAGGEMYLSSKVASRLLKSATGRGVKKNKSIGDLTDRELEIFEMIGLGHSGSEIAFRLNISSKTVDAHRANIRAKLGYPDITTLVRAAILWMERKDSPSIPET